jgi:16S rRNA C967 or C1407 C5-methylase (RsmB/RsmF family)
VRLAAQVRGGFYPAHEEAVAHAAAFLRVPTGQPFAILDPCAGTGGAIRQIGETLGCDPDLVYAIELDDSRAEAVHASLAGARVLAPADFFGRQAPDSTETNRGQREAARRSLGYLPILWWA